MYGKDIPDDEKEEFVFVSKNWVTLNLISRHRLNCSIGRPRSREDLENYDIVIFLDVNSSDFTKELLNWIKEYYEAGGAIMMGGGWASFGGYHPVTN